MISFIEFNNISAISEEVAISVGHSAAVAYAIPAGKKGVSFQNVGSKIAWYGGAGVDPSTNRGVKLFSNQTLVFKNVKNSFTIYFLCGGTDTTSIGVVNYD